LWCWGGGGWGEKGLHLYRAEYGRSRLKNGLGTCFHLQESVEKDSGLIRTKNLVGKDGKRPLDRRWLSREKNPQREKP